MKLILNNIGAFKKAEVDLDGIALIIGNNSTGKSTVGRALYLLTSALYQLDAYIEADRTETSYRVLKKYAAMLDSFLVKLSGRSRRVKVAAADEMRKNCAEALVQSVTLEEIQFHLLEYIAAHAELYGVFFGDLEYGPFASDFAQWKERITQELEGLHAIPDSQIAQEKVTQCLDYYFNGQIIRIPFAGEEIEGLKSFISLEDEYGKNVLHFERDKKEGKDYCSSVETGSINTLPVYIEDPRVMNKLKWSSFSDSYSMPKLYMPEGSGLFYQQVFLQVEKEATTATEKIEYDKLAKGFQQQLEEMAGGKIVLSPAKGYQFQKDGLSRNIPLQNLSTGIKSILLLESALKDGALKKNGILILDEPEINLHPEWQLRYAHVLVKLQKALNLRVVVTSHSPYFAEALDYYYQLENPENKNGYHFYQADGAFDEYSQLWCADTFPGYAYKKLMDPFAELAALYKKIEDKNKGAEGYGHE